MDDVRSDKWFDVRNTHGYYVRESFFATGPGSVVNLLWWEDEKQIIDLQEEKEQSAASRRKRSSDLWVFGEVFGKEFQGHEAAELGVLRLVYHTHAAAAGFLDDAVVRNRLADELRLTGENVTECLARGQLSVSFGKALATKMARGARASRAPAR
jgi:hypothetical protein